MIWNQIFIEAHINKSDIVHTIALISEMTICLYNAWDNSVSKLHFQDMITLN